MSLEPSVGVLGVAGTPSVMMARGPSLAVLDGRLLREPAVLVASTEKQYVVCAERSRSPLAVPGSAIERALVSCVSSVPATLLASVQLL